MAPVERSPQWQSVGRSERSRVPARCNACGPDADPTPRGPHAESRRRKSDGCSPAGVLWWLMAIRKSPPAVRGAKLKRAAAAAPTRVTRAVTILRPAQELYDFWRRLENVTRVVKYPVTITTLSENESHWSVTAPGGKRVEWDAVITEERQNELISWRSREGADVPNSGRVQFIPAPPDEGTEVVVDLEYLPPGGKLAALLAKLTGKEAGQQVMETLRRFKALMEAGEIPTIEGQPAGGPQAPRKGRK